MSHKTMIFKYATHNIYQTKIIQSLAVASAMLSQHANTVETELGTAQPQLVSLTFPSPRAPTNLVLKS